MTDGKTGDLGDGYYARTYNWWLSADTAWEAPCPGLRPPAIDYIAAHLPADGQVLEWGAGGSTIWLAPRCGQLTTLEMDGEWYHQVLRRLDLLGLLPKVRLLYFGPQADERARWRTYADYILTQDDGAFALVLIDGRSRSRCLANAMRKVQPGGLLCLDNTERGEYATAVVLVNGWPRLDWGDEGLMTTIWTRPRDWTPPRDRVVLPEAEA